METVKWGSEILVEVEVVEEQEMCEGCLEGGNDFRLWLLNTGWLP